MKKLQLAVDELRVVSFEVAPERASLRGTVYGAAGGDPPWTITIPDTSGDTSDCTAGYTCDQSGCEPSCGLTCPPGC